MSGDELARVTELVRQLRDYEDLTIRTCQDAADLLESTAARLAEADAVVDILYRNNKFIVQAEVGNTLWMRHINEALERHKAARDEYIECNSPWERVPVCACDPGRGEPPSKLKQLECKMRGGPCAERGGTVDTAGLNPADPAGSTPAAPTSASTPPAPEEGK